MSELSKMLRRTWKNWRSGALTPVSGRFVKLASGSYGDFCRTLQGFQTAGLERFFEQTPPRPDEFLIACNISGQTGS